MPEPGDQANPTRRELFAWLWPVLACGGAVVTHAVLQVPRGEYEARPKPPSPRRRGRKPRRPARRRTLEAADAKRSNKGA